MAKKHKLDIFTVLDQISRKKLDYYDALSEEEQKAFMVSEGRGRWVPVWQAWEEDWPWEIIDTPSTPKSGAPPCSA